MSEELDRSRGLSRRQTLKRGAALGGALLWATPAVQSLTMKPAFAQVTPRVDGVEGASFIAMNVVCLDGPFVIKLECNGTCAWEPDPGEFPDCDFSPEGEKASGAAKGFTFTGPDPVTGCVTVLVPPTCRVKKSAIKGGDCCVAGAKGTGLLEFCPC